MNKKIGLFTLIVIFIVTLFIAITYIFDSELETFIIDSKFSGQVVIVFNHPNGQMTEYNNESRVYRIPESGVLLTKFKQNKGLRLQRINYESFYKQITKNWLDNSLNHSNLIRTTYNGFEITYFSVDKWQTNNLLETTKNKIK